VPSMCWAGMGGGGGSTGGCAAVPSIRWAGIWGNGWVGAAQVDAGQCAKHRTAALSRWLHLPCIWGIGSGWALHRWGCAVSGKERLVWHVLVCLLCCVRQVVAAAALDGTAMTACGPLGWLILVCSCLCAGFTEGGAGPGGASAQAEVCGSGGDGRAAAGGEHAAEGGRRGGKGLKGVAGAQRQLG
jgi:hypothetical protein